MDDVPRPDLPSGTSADERFGPALRRAREAAGVTQEQLAANMRERRFDFHQATIYKIETGKRRVTVGEAAALAELVGKPIDSLIGTAARLDEASTATERAVRNYQREARAFGLVLLDLAVVADETAVIDARIAAWLADSLTTHTPFQMATEVVPAVDGEIERRNIDPTGKHVRLLREGLKRDQAALNDVWPHDG